MRRRSNENAMYRVNSDGSVWNRFHDAMPFYICLGLLSLLIGCVTVSFGDEESTDVFIDRHDLSGDPNNQKRIFVFLDGTENDPASGTNVWRLYDLLSNNNDPQMTAVYIEGVGTAEDAPIVDAALGHGMENRILTGYEFVAANYRPGDEIYLFGFSRGAHQARALAGLISYAGIPRRTDNGDSELMDVGNQIIELVKKKSDASYAEQWLSWSPDQPPVLATEIRDQLGFEMQPARIQFLGVWDTVPGSSLKKYRECKEDKGFVKTYLWWLIPGVDRGERYKVDSYPPIGEIAHAVALDEKRSKFTPLLVCEAINPEYTKVTELWFPGAHADVGGGYDDSTDLPSISLRWMIEMLGNSYTLEPPPAIEGAAAGLAHWSIGDFPQYR